MGSDSGPGISCPPSIMFKRVDRRLKRKAEQEELGIDSELKEALGIPDTDSDESDSDGDSDDSDEDSHEGGLDVEVDEDENAEALSNAGSGDELSERDDPDEIEMTIDQALTNPLYPSPSDPDTTLCFVCPGRQLKASSQIDIHLKSKARTISPQYSITHSHHISIIQDVSHNSQITARMRTTRAKTLGSSYPKRR